MIFPASEQCKIQFPTRKFDTYWNWNLILLQKINISTERHFKNILFHADAIPWGMNLKYILRISRCASKKNCLNPLVCFNIFATNYFKNEKLILIYSMPCFYLLNYLITIKILLCSVKFFLTILPTSEGRGSLVGS